MKERTIRRRKPDVDAAADNLLPQDVEHFRQAAQQFGWEDDWVVEDEDGIVAIVHKSRRDWAEAIKARRIIQGRKKKKAKWRRFE